MITQSDLAKVLSAYDINNITIGVIGSHSALDVCRGAKDLGFRTLVVCQEGRERTYSHHYKTNGATGIVDETIVLKKFKNILDKSVQEKLRTKNVIFIPHRSFEVYLEFNYQAIENDFLVPLFGNRCLLKVEERNQPNNQYDLLRKATIRMPHIFKNHTDIDRLCLVKLPEKERTFERSFFYCSSPKEFETMLKNKIKTNQIDAQEVKNAVIEEYIIGPFVNFNFFYSSLTQRVELLGTDTRRQTNIEGIAHLGAKKQIALAEHITPKFEEAGHSAVTVLESMLEQAFELGERFTKTAAVEYKPGVIGPFALQSAILPGPPKKDIVVFDVSLRMPGSPGTCFTPYTGYLHGTSVSAGKRVAMEIKQAIEQNRLLEVIT